MKQNIILYLLCTALLLFGCETPSKKSIKDALIKKFEAFYAGTGYDIELYDSGKREDIYIIWSENYYGVLTVRDNSGDICIYSYYSDISVYMDHCEGVKTG